MYFKKCIEIDPKILSEQDKSNARKDLHDNVLEENDYVAFVLGVKYYSESAPEIRQIPPDSIKYFEIETYDNTLTPPQYVKQIRAEIFFSGKLQRWCAKVIKVT